MNLLEVRQKARILTGRFDLVNNDGSDNGMDFHINQGMKWLDRTYLHQKTAGRYFTMLASGDYFASFPYCRAIKEVWIASTSSRWQLEKLSIQDFRAAYPNQWGDIATADPLYYTPAFLRAVPETSSIAIGDMDAIIGYTDVMIGENYEYNGVLLAPRANGALHLEVWGYFYTEPLSDDDSKNYWSVNHSDVLIASAMRHIEVFNRNTQGENDWANAISRMMDGVDKDIVEEDIAEIDQMEG